MQSHDPNCFELDYRLIRQRNARTAFNADAIARREKADFLAREVGRRMAERLEYIKHEPDRILDLGCGLGGDLPLLNARYPTADKVALDTALPLLQHFGGKQNFLTHLFRSFRKGGAQAVCASIESLPVARGTMQLAWSNLVLNWLHDPMPAIRETHRVLSVGGMFMFSTLGPDTLRELRTALGGRAGERVHRFIDMHDLGDCLIRAGFAEPVMDMEVITVDYASLDALFDDLKASASNNASHTRPRGLSGRSDWARARERYETFRRNGRLPANFEVVYGHAWKAAPKTLEDGRAVIQFRPYEKK